MDIIDNLQELRKNNFWVEINSADLINIRSFMSKFKEKTNVSNDLLFFFYDLLGFYFKDNDIIFTTPNIQNRITTEECEILFENIQEVENSYIKVTILSFIWQYKKLSTPKKNFNAALCSLDLYLKLVDIMLEKQKEPDTGLIQSYIIRVLSYGIAVSLSIGSNLKIDFLSKIKNISNFEYNEHNSSIILGSIKLLIKYASQEDIKLCLNKLTDLLYKIPKNDYVQESIYDMAIDIARKTNDKNVKENLLKEKAEIYMMRANKASNTQAKVHFLKKASNIYRDIPSCKEKWQSLNREIELISPRIIEEMAPIKVELKIDTSRIAKSAELVRNKNFHQALKELARCIMYMPTEKQIKDIISQTSTISDLVSSLTLDEKGFTASIIGDDKTKYSLSFYSALNYVWWDTCYCELSPMLSVISHEHFFSYEDFMPFCRNNQFVPIGREEIFAKGLYYFFKRDFLLSSSILIPQIENSFRNMLYGTETITKIYTSGKQEYKIQIESMLKNILDKKIISERMYFNLYMLLCDEYFNIRNRLAHGLLAYDIFESQGIFILNWFVFYFVCAPTLLYDELIGNVQNK